MNSIRIGAFSRRLNDELVNIESVALSYIYVCLGTVGKVNVAQSASVAFNEL